MLLDVSYFVDVVVGLLLLFLPHTHSGLSHLFLTSPLPCFPHNTSLIFQATFVCSVRHILFYMLVFCFYCLYNVAVCIVVF